jgi:hypothetical protein
MTIFINVLYHYTHHQRKIHKTASIPNTKRDFSDSGMPGIKTSWLLSEFCNYFDSKASALWSKMSIGIVIDTIFYVAYQIIAKSHQAIAPRTLQIKSPP